LRDFANIWDLQDLGIVPALALYKGYEPEFGGVIRLNGSARVIPELD
jgi:hypothetical protein